MAKSAGARGFSAQGGGQPRASRSAGYTVPEMTAMSKLNSNNAFSGQVVLCSGCGRAVSTAGPYDAPGVLYPYDAQANFKVGNETGWHFTCHAEKVRVDQAKADAAYNAIPEDERARAFNDGPVGAAPAAKPAPYQFKPGELPLSRVQAAGGLSKFSGEPAPTPPPISFKQPSADEEARDAKQAAAHEAQLRADLAAELAILNGTGAVDYSEHDAAAAVTNTVYELGDSI